MEIRLKSLVLFAVYLGLVVTGIVTALPAGVVFPDIPFFVAFSVLPCAVAWMAAAPLHERSVAKMMIGLLGAMALFLLAWAAQLYAVVQYAQVQDSRPVGGLLSNFHVFTHRFLPRGLIIAALVLLAVSVAARLQGRNVTA